MSAVEEQVLQELQLNRIFNDDILQFDLRGGVIINPAKSRVVLLTADLLGGVYRGLIDEAGAAWKPILHNCGKIWGSRVAARLERECQSCLGLSASTMPLGNYLQFITGYFAFHGWGKMELKLDQALSRGIVAAELRGSIFVTVIDDPEEMADPMIAGMLGSMLGTLSRQPLDGVQTACPSKGADCSRFLITAATRLTQAEQLLKLGSTHEQLWSTL